MSSSNSRRAAGEGGGARDIAARVLVRVWEADAFAAAALDAELRREKGLDPRDAGLATELVYGALRTQGALETRLLDLASKKRPVEDATARAHLLMGAYSICFLDRIPPFAAVSEAVDGARAAAGTSVGGFVNAVLRRLAAEVEAKGRPALREAIVASAPGWLRGALRRSLGRAPAEAYLTAGLVDTGASSSVSASSGVSESSSESASSGESASSSESASSGESASSSESASSASAPSSPPIGLCLAPSEDRGAWIERLREAAPGASIEPGAVAKSAILVRGAGDVRRLPGWGTAWIIQEEGAQLVALALGVRPGDRALDACSGRGNKAWLLTHAAGAEGVIDAADLFEAKLSELRAGPSGARVRQTFVVDWIAGSGDVPLGAYDRVLVDAPCSGTGTLRRRPEIMIHREECDLARLSALQTAIVRQAARHVRPGGRLVFAVCSVLREEAEDVISKLIAEPIPAGSAGEGSSLVLVPAPFDADVLQGLAGSEAKLRLLPHVHGTDGYFIASFTVEARDSKLE